MGRQGGASERGGRGGAGEKFGSSEQKARHLAALRAGRFFGTMASTALQAGSSLSDLKTSATPREDDSYLIKSQKIFILGGDHELSNNFVHLVLARGKATQRGSESSIARTTSSRRGRTWLIRNSGERL